MKHILLAFCMIPFLLGTTVKENNNSVVVLELFTSQGCSSCPPADKLLDKVIDNPNVIGLSYHVDYWNYIGWKDPYSKSEFTNKQRAYSRKFYSSSIYTPQIVINGREHFVGSNQSIMTRKLKEYLAKKSDNSITLTNAKRGEEFVSFNYDVTGTTSGKSLSVILVLKEKTTQVKRGENRNRTLRNSNIVITEQTLKLDNANSEGAIKIPDTISNSDELSLVVVIKDEDLNVSGASQTLIN